MTNSIGQTTRVFSSRTASEVGSHILRSGVFGEIHVRKIPPRQHEPSIMRRRPFVWCVKSSYIPYTTGRYTDYTIFRDAIRSRGILSSQFSQHLSPPHSQLTIFTDAYFTARVAVHSSEGRALSLIALCIFDTSLQKKTIPLKPLPHWGPSGSPYRKMCAGSLTLT